MFWMHSLDSSSFRQLAGTENAVEPFWSPDSRKIGFFAVGKLKTFDTQGGSVAIVCAAPAGAGASWSSGGTILLAPNGDGPLSSVSESGGAPAPLTKLRAGERSHVRPFFLPDGKTSLFLAMNESLEKSAICQTTLDRPGEIKTVTQVLSPPVWVEPGIVLYAKERRLLAQRYDAKRAAMVGEPSTVSDQF